MKKVKNINGNSVNACSCGSWLKHWTNFAGKPAVFCSEHECKQMKLLFGAHVQTVDSDSNWYIVPLCEKHNSSDVELMINDFIKLIPAEKDDACG